MSIAAALLMTNVAPVQENIDTLEHDDDFITSTLSKVFGSVSFNSAGAAEAKIKTEKEEMEASIFDAKMRADAPEDRQLSFDDDQSDERNAADEHKERCEKWEDKYQPQGCYVKKDISKNGCSVPANTSGISNVSYYNQFFHYSCNTHDTCYAELGSDKNACDASFRQNMLNNCSSRPLSNGITQAQCRATANNYYNLMRNVASFSNQFQITQEKAACNEFIALRDKKNC